MRPKYSSISLYKILEEIASLPDLQSTIPYYDKRYSKFDIFYTFTRQNPDLDTGSGLMIYFSIFKKEKVHRISFASTIRVFSTLLDFTDFTSVLFDPRFQSLNDFIIFLNGHYPKLQECIFELERLEYE